MEDQTDQYVDSTAELNHLFGTGNEDLHISIVSELESMMALYQLSAQDLSYKWEEYQMKMDVEPGKISEDILRDFKQTLQTALERSAREVRAKAAANPVGTTPRASVKGTGSDVFGMLDGLTVTPSAAKSGNKRAASARKKPYDAPASSWVRQEPAGSSPVFKLEDQLSSLGALPPTSFKDRPNAGKVNEILNEQLASSDPPVAPFVEPRIKLTAASDQKKLSYKPMVMKLSEASEILDDRIDCFAGLVMDHYNLDDTAFGSAASQSTTEVVAVGRIASDSAEGKLNAASLVLETSRRIGNGLRIPLNLDLLKGNFQFFPGQIVALRGRNASGKEFTVAEVLSLPLLPNAASNPAALDAHRERLRGGPEAMDSDADPAPLDVLFASGPYTADDNVDFEPLYALCTLAADEYVDAMVLTGPFLDAEHPLIATGDFDLPSGVDPDTATLTTVFRHLISPAFNRLASANPTITILLVPSVRDAVDKHVSWPQEAFPRRDLGLPKTAKVVGNPITLNLNETVLAISSQDVLLEIKNEELVGLRRPDAEILSRCARHLVEQRHFFPLFPSSDRRKLPKTGVPEAIGGGGLPPGAMLDVSYLKLGEMVNNVRPDVLVTPSALPAFARVVESVIIINPGTLSRRRGAGTYARLILYAAEVSAESREKGEVVGHDVYKRARVEIRNI